MMRVTINNPHQQLRDPAIHSTRERILGSLSKFGDHVISADFTAEDINGPRGGIDKACRLVVKLKQMDDVVVTATEETFSKAISLVVNRAQRAVNRRVQRRNLRVAGRRTKYSSSFFN